MSDNATFYYDHKRDWVLRIMDTEVLKYDFIKEASKLYTEHELGVLKPIDEGRYIVYMGIVYRYHNEQLIKIRKLTLSSIERLEIECGVFAAECFGVESLMNPTIRIMNILEEAIELGQAGGIDKEHLHSLVDYVYDRPKGKLKQEMAGLLNTLAALSESLDTSLSVLSSDELGRNWENIDLIREKASNKPHLNVKTGFSGAIVYQLTNDTVENSIRVSENEFQIPEPNAKIIVDNGAFESLNPGHVIILHLNQSDNTVSTITGSGSCIVSRPSMYKSGRYVNEVHKLRERSVKLLKVKQDVWIVI